MKRYRRTFLIFTALVSALILVATVALWIRGSFASDVLSIRTSDRSALHVMGGHYLGVIFIHVNFSVPVTSEPRMAFHTNAVTPERYAWFPPVEYSMGSSHLSPADGSQYNFVVHWWILTMLSFSALALLLLRPALVLWKSHRSLRPNAFPV